MREALSRIDHGDEKILATRITSDERGVIDGIQHLAPTSERLFTEP